MSSRKDRGRAHKVEEPVIVMEAEVEEAVEDGFPIDEHMEAVQVLESGDVMGEEAAEDDHIDEDSPNAKKGGRRKPLTAWSLFCMQQRKLVADEYPELTFGGVNAKMAEIWKSMGDPEKLAYEPKDDGEGRYDGGGDDTPKKRGRKKRTRKWTKDPSAPKKALTPYIVFGKTIRDLVTAELKQDDPNTKPTDIMREISHRWTSLSAAERVPYELQASKDKERYETEKKAWAVDHPEPRVTTKKAKGMQEPGEQRVLRVRHRGEDLWDKVFITLPCTLKQLIKKIQSKRRDMRPIIEIVHLPDHRVRDSDDIASLLDEAPLEIVFEAITSSSMDAHHAVGHHEEEEDVMAEEEDAEGHHVDDTGDVPAEDEE